MWPDDSNIEKASSSLRKRGSIMVKVRLASTSWVTVTAATTAAVPTAPVAWSAARASPITASTATTTIARNGFFQCPAFQDSLAAEADFAILVNIGNHYGDLIANLDNIFNLIDAFAVEL
jgi:hypothetical protein